MILANRTRGPLCPLVQLAENIEYRCPDVALRYLTGKATRIVGKCFRITIHLDALGSFAQQIQQRWQKHSLLDDAIVTSGLIYDGIYVARHVNAWFMRTDSSKIAAGVIPFGTKQDKQRASFCNVSGSVLTL